MKTTTTTTTTTRARRAAAVALAYSQAAVHDEPLAGLEVARDARVAAFAATSSDDTSAAAP